MIAIASVLSPRCYSRARELCDGRLAAIGAKTHRNNAPYESRAPECAVIPPATSGLPVSLPIQHAWNAAAAAWKDLIAALVQIAAPVAAFDRALDPMPECLLLRRRFAYGDGDNSGGTGALHARRLLAALQEIYTNRAEIPSAEIVRLLAADPDAEWCEYRGRTPISQRQLALLLKV